MSEDWWADLWVTKNERSAGAKENNTSLTVFIWVLQIGHHTKDSPTAVESKESRNKLEKREQTGTFVMGIKGIHPSYRQFRNGGGIRKRKFYFLCAH